MRRRLSGLVLVLTLSLLGGCATVPTSGPVREHTPQQQQMNSGVEVAPVPPPRDASPMLIVEGFLHAMATYQVDYQVARAYLTESAKGAWHPESGAQIYADGYPPTETQDTVVLVAPITGALDAAGTYRSADRQLRHDFALVQDPDGQWRISNPPAGLLLSRYLFVSGYVSVALHFYDTTGSVLVPDPRFFPGGQHALTAAIQAQLAGPSAWLRPAVRSGGAGGGSLIGVNLDRQGVAQIELSDTGGSSADQRRRTLAEMAHTATQLDGVVGVTIRAETETWTLPGESRRVFGPAQFTDESPVDQTGARELFAVRDGRLQRLSTAAADGELVPAAPALTRLVTAAVRADVTEAAGVEQGRTRLLSAPVGMGVHAEVMAGSGLIRPQYARNGELWSADRQGLRAARGESLLKVRQPATVKGAVTAFRLSPDGSRIAVVARGAAGTRLELAVVIRVGDEVRIEDWREVELTGTAGRGGEVLDVGWASATDLIVLVSGRGGGSGVLRLDQDSAIVADIGPSDGSDLVELAVAPGRPAMVRSASGTVYRFNGEFNWGLALTSVDDVVYSG